MENLGIERSYQAMADADLTMVVVDSPRRCDPKITKLSSAPAGRVRFLIAANKCDLPGRGAEMEGAIRYRRYPAKALPDCAGAIVEALAPRRTNRTGRRIHHQPAP